MASSRNDSVSYRSVREYTDALRKWLAMQQSHFYSQSQYSTLFMPQLSSFVPPLPFLPPPQQQFPGAPLSFRNGEYYIPPHPNQVSAPPTSPPQQPALPQDFSLPPPWKRAVAELIDFCILLVIKITISLLVFRNFGLMQEESMDLEFLYEVLYSGNANIDYDKLMSITSEMITIQLIHRLCITVTEALWICKSFRGGIGGSTPGKLLMGLRVVGCDDVIGLGENQVRLTNARNLGLVSAFVRSFLKNYGVSFFFPVVLTVYMFDHYRAVYDQAARSIVVCHQPINDLHNH